MIFINLRDERGTTLVEFALSAIVFFGFLYGLFAISMWGIGANFLQEAAHEASREYAVTLDEQQAKNKASRVLTKYAYIFVDKNSIRVDVRKSGDKSVVNVSGIPLIKKLYIYSMPKIEKTSICTLEYRFRNPSKFNR